MTEVSQMRTRIAALALLALAQTACFGVNEKNWADRWAKNRCQFAKSCEKATFWYNYEDMDECVDHQLELYQEADDLYDGCTFDKKEARACIKALNSRCKVAGAEYETRFEACGDVFDCGGDAEDTSAEVAP
jgi:hypothetical protein